MNMPRLQPADPLLYTSCVGTCDLKQVTNPLFSVFAYLMSIRTPKTVPRTKSENICASGLERTIFYQQTYPQPSLFALG